MSSQIKKTRKEYSAFNELINILNSKKKRIYTKMLHDGSVFVYSNKHIIASFKYFGGTNIIDLKINTKKYLGREFYRKIKLSDVCMRGGDELSKLLSELFPDARKCNYYMRHAHEFGIIEAAILDPNTRIEVSRRLKKCFDVALVNHDNNISASFRYFIDRHLKHVYLRYNHKRGTKIAWINIPQYRLNIFNDLLTRELTPID